MKARLLVLAALLAGCALTSKSAPVDIRWFTPENATVHTAAAETRTPACKLRLGRVTSAAFLRSRIVFRSSASELAEYDDRRWTEDPEAYVRRALARTLFEEKRAVQVVAGDAPVLDVEVVAFEEVRRGDARAGRVELTYVLHDDRDVLASGRLAVERPASSAEARDVVAAIGLALDDMATQVAEAVRSTRAPGGVR